MVSPPKTLYDLRRIEAAVRITCRACRRAVVHDREELIALRFAHRRSLDWQVFCGEAVCDSCAARDVAVAALPFSENAAELRARRGQVVLANLAIAVLEDAARHAKDVDAATPAVRLALRVLHPHLGDQAMLVTFWIAARDARDGKAFNGAQQALRWIIQRLVDRGFPVWAELR